MSANEVAQIAVDAKCPRCGGGARFDAGRPGVCAECGAGLLVDDGRVFDVGAYPRRIDGADVRAVIATELRRHHVAVEFHLVDVHPVTLPYWLHLDGTLRAAFATPLDAILKLSAPAGVAPPARLERAPQLGSTSIDGAVARLVVLPAFDVLYEAAGRSFHAVVDAHQGHVYADLHPHPRPLRVTSAMAAVLAGDVTMFALVAWLAPNVAWRVGLICALVLPVYVWNQAAMRWAYREER